MLQMTALRNRQRKENHSKMISKTSFYNPHYLLFEPDMKMRLITGWDVLYKTIKLCFSYCHRRKVCPGHPCSQALSFCDLILWSERKQTSDHQHLWAWILAKMWLLQRCEWYYSLFSHSCKLFFVLHLIPTLPLFLFFLFGVSISKSSSSLKQSPFSSASSTLCRLQEGGWRRTISISTYFLHFRSRS